MIREIFNGLSSSGKLLVTVLIISLISVLISLWTGGLAATIVVSVLIIGILNIAKNAWESDYDAKTKVRLVSIGVIYLLAILQPAWKTSVNSPTWKTLVNPLLEPLLDQLKIPKEAFLSELPSFAVLFLVIAAIILINYFMRDASVMKAHPVPINQDFPEKKYSECFKSFCKALKYDLGKIDKDTNWSTEYFTPIDAEVEVQSGSKRLRKVTDLLNAIQADRTSQIFLVLGDPGSGKSVALRKLCQDLLEESQKTGKVPVYINLREWDPQYEWTEETPPTVEELYDFVVKNLKARGNVFTNEFIDVYFRKMFEHGRLFIVLDSFDEIPAVLDVGEDSWLIDTLSDVIYRFLTSPHDESRGILSSRIFRKPTDKFDAKSILEIRPFTEKKIIQTLKKSLFFDQKLVEQIFKEKQEFVPIARNPFTAALISNYAKNNENNLPQNQADLYSSYISRRLDECRERIQKRNLTNEKILECSIDIAYSMFSSQILGLEASIKDLKIQFKNHPIEDVVDILQYSLLGRLGSGDENRFSFVHRRFNEYFVVQHWIKQPHLVPQDAIPTDSRWRDALALYCEVAEEENAKQIANFCWNEIRKIIENFLDIRDPQFLRALHCLRFLKEAFRARPICIDDFREELCLFIKTTITHNENLLLKKFSVEAVGLLKPEQIDDIIIQAFRLNNDWINETALKACRHLPKISDALNTRLLRYLDSFNFLDLFVRKDDLSFSLKLSNGFVYLDKFLNFRVCDLYCFIIGFILLFIITPMTAIILLTFVLFFEVRWPFKAKSNRNNRMFYFYNLLFFYTMQLFSLIRGKGFLHEITFVGNEVILISALSALQLLLFTPFYKIIYYVIPFIRKIKSINDLLFFLINKVKSSFLILLSMFITIFICAILMKNYPSIFIITIGIIAFCILSCISFLVAVMFFHDFLLLRNFKERMNAFHELESKILSRKIISDEFKSYKTGWGQLKYVEFIQNEKIKPTGIWENNELPFNGKSEGSILLAKLEEKWLGLDR